MAHKASPLSPDEFGARLQALRPSDTYALAVSGGGDSMGLLALAGKLATQSDAPRFIALTVDHGLRPQARAEAEMVAAACDKLNIDHHILSPDKPLGRHDIQQQARNMRYRLMAAQCRVHSAPLVTAHHRADQAETIAMRLARGSGIDGLAGMAVSQWLETEAGPLLLLRPFLTDAPASLHAVRAAASLDYAHDPSNENMSFERVRWRQKMPDMAEAGLSSEALLALGRDMRWLKNHRDDTLSAWLSQHASWHEAGVLSWPRAAFTDLSADLQEKLLSQSVRYFGHHQHPPKRAAISKIAARMGALNSGVAVLGGVLMRWRSKEMFLGREYAALTDGAYANVGEGVWDRRFIIDNVPNGHFVAPLGEKGVAALRAQGVCFDKTVPAAYHAVLPAFFDEKTSQTGAPCGLATEKYGRHVSSLRLFDALLGRGQGW